MPDGGFETETRARPRHDLDAERKVLAAILLDGEGRLAVLPRVQTITRAEDFYDPRHALVFTVAGELQAEGQPVDVITVCAKLKARDRINTVDRQFVGELTDETFTVAHCEAHARIVAECALTRRVFEAAAAVQRKALDARAGAGDLLVEAQKLVEVATHRATTAQTVALGDVVDLELDRMEADVDATVRPTGLDALDRALLGGPREGDLIIPGGRPSAGKTALGVQIAHTMADAGWPVLFFSLEMPRLSVLQRVVAQRAGIDLGLIRARAFTTIDDTNAYLHAVDAVRRLPLHLVDDAVITPAGMRVAALALRARVGRLGAVVVDYLQRTTPDRPCESREQEIASVAKALKNLARELQCPVIAPAQLKRDLDDRGGRKRGRGDAEDESEEERPRMSDFRGSGEIEQEADILLAIHRPRKAAATRELWVLKQRNGPADGVKVDLVWEKGPARFVEAPAQLPAPSDESHEDPGTDWRW